MVKRKRNRGAGRAQAFLSRVDGTRAGAAGGEATVCAGRVSPPGTLLAQPRRRDEAPTGVTAPGPAWMPPSGSGRCAVGAVAGWPAVPVSRVLPAPAASGRPDQRRRPGGLRSPLRPALPHGAGVPATCPHPPSDLQPPHGSADCGLHAARRPQALATGGHRLALAGPESGLFS